MKKNPNPSSRRPKLSLLSRIRDWYKSTTENGSDYVLSKGITPESPHYAKSSPKSEIHLLRQKA